MSSVNREGVDLTMPSHLGLVGDPGPPSEYSWPPESADWPDHTGLPSRDDTIVENLQEMPQVILLSEALRPILRRLHPDGRFVVGGNSGIYWNYTEPPLRGAICPDWFYVPGVTPGGLRGSTRRSYVLWKELVPPLVVMEFVSGDGSEERDRTPGSGKFWVYENRVKANYYVIFEYDPARIEVYVREGGVYRPVPANAAGVYPIADLGVCVGTWDGTYLGQTLPWLRWCDDLGDFLPTGFEVADHMRRLADDEARRADDEARRADDEARRAEAFAARLRALGIDPDEVAGSA